MKLALVSRHNWDNGKFSVWYELYLNTQVCPLCVRPYNKNRTYSALYNKEINIRGVEVCVPCYKTYERICNLNDREARELKGIADEIIYKQEVLQHEAHTYAKEHWGKCL